MQYQLDMIGYDAILVRFTDTDNTQCLPLIYALNQQLKNAADLSSVIIDIIPSYQTLLISYDILKIEPHQLAAKIHQYLQRLLNTPSIQPVSAVTDCETLITLPVCYHESLAPDIKALSQYASLSVSDIIQIHSSTIYSCYAIGFMPNFAYLGNIDKRIYMPRHTKPKSQVTAGSVGIADNQTAIYPKTSPGGWQIIGQSPASLHTLTVGCQVKFNAISLDEFNHYPREAENNDNR